MTPDEGMLVPRHELVVVVFFLAAAAAAAAAVFAAAVLGERGEGLSGCATAPTLIAAHRCLSGVAYSVAQMRDPTKNMSVPGLEAKPVSCFQNQEKRHPGNKPGINQLHKPAQLPMSSQKNGYKLASPVSGARDKLAN